MSSQGVKSFIIFYLILSVFPAYSDSLNSLNSKENLPAVSKEILISIEDRQASPSSRVKEKSILMELNEASTKYFKDLDRLFFFSYYREVNAGRIRDLVKSFHCLCDENTQDEELQSMRHPLQKAMERWENLHSSYKYYVGYFF